jgi:DNA repair protein RecO
MREKYHTEAIILKASDFKESNKLYHLFTERFGLILANAQGVRFLKSKLRYGLQEYSLSDVSVVRTGDIWKITNSVPKKNFYFEHQDDKKKLDVILRTTTFLRRFLHGEEEGGELYREFKDAFLHLSDVREGNEAAFEGALLVRILGQLGILKHSAKISEILNAPDMAGSISKFVEQKEIALYALNASLEESQI